MEYKSDVLKAVKRKWDGYRDSTSTSQTKAAKAMGMNQSALSQYLRGEIPLNTDFLSKFTKLTNTSMEDYGVKASASAEVTAHTLEVKYTLSGRTLSGQTAMVASVVSAAACYAVVVDYTDFIHKKGTLFIVDPDATVSDGDTVMLLRDIQRPVYGRLESIEGEWQVLEPHYYGGQVHAIDSSDEVHRVSGTYNPEVVGRTFKE